MKLISAVFEQGGMIPSKYTCDGQNVNPPLEISDVPAQAKSLALIMDDPDVPEKVRKDRLFVHWVIVDMSPMTHHLVENSEPPGVVGKNSAGQSHYFGPCPPDGEHRYFFKLYALDTLLHLDSSTTKEILEKAMHTHILTETELLGRYIKLALR
jgi:Raf kinase inhibitor-like YbhB/YbcL family protein